MQLLERQKDTTLLLIVTGDNRGKWACKRQEDQLQHELCVHKGLEWLGSALQTFFKEKTLYSSFLQLKGFINNNSQNFYLVWWHTFISVPEKLRQEDIEFTINLSYTVKSYFRKKNINFMIYQDSFLVEPLVNNYKKKSWMYFQHSPIFGLEGSNSL